MGIKIAFVVQRYGAEIIGGAELLTRELAERLHASLGWQVDVYTTTARDYQTWANHYPAGEETLGGVRVRRFNSLVPRAPFFNLFNRWSAPLMQRLRRRRLGRPFCRLLERVWIFLQGPYCPSLLRALARTADDYRKIIFVTYLYYPTLAGIGRYGDKAVLIPLAHDEHPFHFLTVERMLRKVRAMITNIEPESWLIQPKLAGAPVRMEVAGVGFDESKFLPVTEKKAKSAPYLLYLGRISGGKGVAQLISWFQSLPNTDGLKLKLAGHREESVIIPDDPRFEYLGFVDEATKLDLMRGALALVNPSPHESLSMIVIEAMALQIPVLVNAHSAVLRYYTERVPTAFGFRDQEEFARQLAKVTATDWLDAGRRQDLEISRTWALKTFSWSHVLSVYQRVVE